MRIARILDRKGTDVVTVKIGADSYHAISKMVDRNVGSVVVIDEDPQRDGPQTLRDHDVRGIFTERDFLRHVALEERDPHRTPVESVMTEDVICVDPDFTVEECMAIMTSERFRHLPVIHEGGLGGIISIGDCVKELSEEAQIRIHYLEDYIKGTYPR